MSWGSQVYGRILKGAVLGAVVAGTGACTKERLVQGECKPFNGGDICTWGRMSGTTLVAFGATVPVKSIENSPAEMPMVWPPKSDAVIGMPAEVLAATGFDHMNIFWEPHGHPPGPYLTPHYDFHFNSITREAVAAINCADSLKPAAVPAAYVLPDVLIPQLGTLIGLCVPGMGMHALPVAEMTGTEPFTRTMVVGYYHQKPIFVEPMIARATLLEKRTFGVDMPEVAGQPANVHTPATFEARYDSTAQAYQFTFSMAAAKS